VAAGGAMVADRLTRAEGAGVGNFGVEAGEARARAAERQIRGSPA